MTTKRRRDLQPGSKVLATRDRVRRRQGTPGGKKQSDSQSQRNKTLLSGEKEEKSVDNDNQGHDEPVLDSVNNEFVEQRLGWSKNRVALVMEKLEGVSL